MKTKTAELVSNDEDRIAEFLRERNLSYTNEISAPVHPADSFYTRCGKRILDIAISAPAFIILFPLNAAFALCTYLDVGKPIFYKQKRTGINGEEFTLVKFRNMNENRDADGNLLPASQRVTKFGKVMRKLSLDELLNFWSVLKGDMSVIGPRPMPVFFTERMSERHKMRNCVRPGLECPYTVPEDGRELSNYHWKFENDIWYVENVSLRTDVMMFWKLIKTTFDMEERGKHASGLSYFVGYDDEGHATSTKKAIATYTERPWL